MALKLTTRCEKCGRPVSKKKFIGKTFYSDKHGILFSVTDNKKARALACVNCLNILEAEHADMIEKSEFEHRTIYTLRPTFIESLQTKLKDFFRARSSVPADVTSPYAKLNLKPRNKRA